METGKIPNFPGISNILLFPNKVDPLIRLFPVLASQTVLFFTVGLYYIDDYAGFPGTTPYIPLLFDPFNIHNGSVTLNGDNKVLNIIRHHIFLSASQH